MMQAMLTVAASALVLSAISGAAIAQTADPMPKQPPQVPAQPPATKQVLTIGKPAPAFELRDLDGRAHGLAQYKGRVVVLEWFDPACPEVRRQHAAALKTLPRLFTQDNIAWVAVHALPASQVGGAREILAKSRGELGIAFPIVLDENGAVTKLYGVTKSPTVFVIDREGVLRYFGAIDNAPAGKLSEGAELKEYLKDALQSVLYGSELATTKTEAQGCPVLPNPAG
jgi:peroxiredoxin